MTLRVALLPFHCSNQHKAIPLIYGNRRVEAVNLIYQTSIWTAEFTSSQFMLTIRESWHVVFRCDSCYQVVGAVTIWQIPNICRIFLNTVSYTSV
ncbi:hypothetical protein EB796_007450 [Bugula neritina]|uniref:Uncharacterized protein n=1 Tax=Bugula neritina TaxID=10212 RepID=A0A7J7K7N5_BUGNE|nr:hypothetical protein EB796_007450 [Bugula neritina]